MGIFNKIRPEEIESGFQQPEPGYEGFILKPEESYPGEFPIFQDEAIPEIQPEETPETENIPEVAEGIIDAANLEGNIWGAFEQDQPLPATSDSESQTLSEEITPEVITEENIEPVMAQTEDEFAGIEIPIPEETNEIDSAEPQVISIDEELKKLLQEEMEKKKEKRSQKESQSAQNEFEPIVEQSEKPKFIPVEETGEAVKFIDMTAFDPNNPKFETETNDLGKPIEVIPEKKSKRKEKSEKAKLSKNVEGKRKSKKVIVWILSSVAGLLVISLVVYFAYIYFQKSFLTNEVTPTATIDSLKRKKEIDKKEKHTEPQQQIKQKVDTSLLVAKESKTEIKKQNETPVIIKKEPTNPTTKISPNPIAKEQPIPTNRSTTPKKNIFPKQKQEKKSDFASITPQPQTTETTPPTEKQIYTIQVYATPSMEDAEFWRQKLMAMKVNDVYISTQKIRDVIWYRVRFGKFTNRQQAIEAAKQFGFSQTWVDRIQ